MCTTNYIYLRWYSSHKQQAVRVQMGNDWVDAVLLAGHEGRWKHDCEGVPGMVVVMEVGGGGLVDGGWKKISLLLNLVVF